VTKLIRELLPGPDDDPALTCDRGMLTFGALRRRVTAVTCMLFGDNGKRLAFCFLPNSVELVIAYLSAVTGGHAVGLLSPATPTVRRRRLIQAYRPEVVIAADDELAEYLPGLGYRPLAWLREQWGLRGWMADPVGDLAPDLALLLSTSGTTGTPKLVRLSGANIAANAVGIAASLGISPAQRAVTSLPLCYSYGLSIVNSHLAAGSCVAVTGQRPMTPLFWQFVHAHDVAEVAGTPLMHRVILSERRGPGLPPSVRVMTQAGGRLGTEQAGSAVAWMKATGGRFYCMYGQTEATARISCLDAAYLARKPDSVGTALPGGHITVGRPLPGGADGPITYTGPNVMMGYATSRPDLARGPEVSVLETGDLGRLDEDGFLYVTGRSSRFVKILDRRVSLDDVEEWFQLPGRCAAVPGRRAAIVVFTTSQDGALEASRRALTVALGAPASAVQVQTIGTIPRTVNGKVDYAELEQAAASQGPGELVRAPVVRRNDQGDGA
jgi:acyl-coenzyme A synthetase/AMP-(fatty) acid ligase